MSRRVVDTKFGRADVRVLRVAAGFLPVLVTGRHRVPLPPVLDAPVAPTEDEAVARLVAAIERIDVRLPQVPAQATRSWRGAAETA